MKRHRFVRHSMPGQLLVWFLIFQVMVFQCVPLFALPAGEQVTHGDVQFTRTPNHLQVNQATSKAIVNFHSFDIGVPETVQFVQPGANAAILNRVTGGMSSEIAGSLLANGNVYLINPNGILFTQSARVDVGGLIASGLQMADSDFLSGRLFFSGGTGSVVNEGSLTGDRIYLIGGTAENRGSISAPEIVMAAGRKSVLLDRAAGGEIRLVIDEEEVAVGEDGVAEALQGDLAGSEAADESGEETAAGTAEIVDAVAEATTTEDVLGEIATVAEAAETVDPELGLDVIAPLESEYELGTIVNEGIIDASGEVGGTISIRGIDVAQMGEVHADGTSGSGGSITILAEDVLVLGSESETTANAGVNGDGGSIIVISENTTHFMTGSRVEMKGGSESGDGGYAEISGHENLSFGGSVDASAPNGELGTVYFDPATLTIVDADGGGGDQDGNLPAILAGATNTTLNTVSWGGIEELGSAAIVELEATGLVLIDDVTGVASNTAGNVVNLSLASGSLTIRSTTDSVFFADPDDTIRTEGGSITIEAGDSIFAGNFDTSGQLSDTSGDVALTATAGTLIMGGATTGGGTFTADAGGDVFVLGALNTGGGDATVTAGLGIDFDNVVDTGGGNLIASATAGNIEAESITSVGSGGDVDLDAGGTLTVNGTTDTGGGNLSADAGGDITFVGAVSANTGTVAATSTGGDIEFQDTVTTAGTGIGVTSTVGSIVFSQMVASAGGAISANAGMDVDFLQAVNSGGGEVRVVAGSDALFSSTVGTSSGDLLAEAGNDLSFVGAVDAGSGNVAATSSGGDVEFQSTLTTADGNIGVTSAVGSIVFSQMVASAGGSISANAGTDVDFQQSVNSGGGDFNVTAANDALINSLGGGLTTVDGNVNVSAGNDATFGGAVNSGAGNVAAASTGGNVEFQDTLTTATGNVSVDAGNNAIFMGAVNTGGGSIGATSMTADVTFQQSVTTVGGNLSATAANDVNVGGIINTVGNGGSVTLASDSDNDAAGNVNVNAAVNTGGGSFTATGENFDNTGGAIDTGTGATGTGGDIHIVFDDTANVAAILQSGDTGVDGGSVTVIASNATGAAAGGLTVAADINSEEGSGGTITVRGGTAIGAGVSLTAGAGSILLDGTADDLVINNALMTDATTFLEANRDVIINAAVSTGSGADLSIEADLDNDTDGGMLVQGGGSVASDGYLVVQGSSIADAGGGGNAVRLATAANTASANGNLLILGKAGSAANSDIDLNALVSASGAGNVSVLSAHGVNQNANITTAGGTVDVDAGNGNITMGAGTATASSGGNIRYAATGDISLDLLNTGTGTGDISVNAGGSILDGNAGAVNVAAGGARLEAVNAIGNLGASDAIELSVSTVAAQAGAGGISVENVGALEIGSVGPVDVNRVATSGTVSTVSDTALAGLNTVSGSIVARTGNGALTVNQAVNALTSGNILLQSQTSGDVAVNAAVFATTGSIEINAVDGVQQTADITAGNTLRVLANNGSVTMTDGTAGVSLGNNIEYSASQDLNIASISAGSGSVYLNAGQSITDAGDTDTDVVGAALNAIAGGGSVGGTTNKLDTQVSTLTANATQDIFIENAGAVAVDTVGPIAVNQVVLNGATMVVNHSSASDLTGANIVLVANNGTITVNDGVDADNVGVDAAGAGNILLQTMTGGGVTLNADVQSGSGNISIVAVDDVTQDANVATTGGSIDIESSTGGINSSGGGVSYNSGGGNITLMAANDITIDDVNAGNGMVGIESTGGSIRDAGDDAGVDVTAMSAALIAGGEVGNLASSEHIETAVANLGAAAGSGIGITESDDVTLAAVSVPVTRVAMDGTSSSSTSKDASGLTTTNGGSIVTIASVGSITVNEAVSADGAGNIRLEAQGAATSDLNLAADVGSGSGSIVVRAEGDILQTSGSVTTTGGTIHALANVGAVTQTDGASVSSGGGNVAVQAMQTVSIANVDAGAGLVHIESLSGNIVDNGDVDTDVVAGGLSMQATSGGIGSNIDKLDTSVSTLAANSDNGIFIENTGAVSIDDVPQFSVNQVGSDGATSPLIFSAQSDLVTSGNGPIVLVSSDTITVNDGANPGDGIGVNANGVGNILLQTLGGGDIALNADVMSGSGHISIISASGVTQSASADILTTGGLGSIDVEAVGGSIVMTDGATAVTGGSSIRYKARGDVQVAHLNTSGGAASWIEVDSTTGSILDGGDTDTDIVADRLQFHSGPGGGVGTLGASADAIETMVDVVAGTADSGGINLLDVDAVEIGFVDPVVAERVQMDGTTVQEFGGGATGFDTTTGGSIVQQTTAGDITVSESVTINGGPGNILLNAQGGGSDVFVNNAVSSAGGNISVVAAATVSQNALGDISAGSGTGDIVVDAQTGITMSDGATAATSGGNVRYSTAAGDATITGIDAGTGEIAIHVPAGSILDAGETVLDAQGSALRMEASGGIGVPANKIETGVSTLAADGGAGGMFIENSGAVSIDDVSTVSADLVNAQGGVTAAASAAGLSDLVSSGGNIVLVSDDTITVNDGSNPGDSIGVNASGAGEILLMTMGTGNIALNAGVVSGTGNISVRGADSVSQGVDGDITTAGAGTIDVEALSGSVAMTNGAVASTAGGNIKYFGGVDVTLGQLNAGSGDVSVKADTGSIIDSDAGDDSNVDIVGTNARLEAGNGIGLAGTPEFIETDIDVLGALGGNGGIFVRDVDDLEIGTVGPIAANRVAMDGTTSILSHPALVGASSTGETDIRTIDGHLTVTDAVDGNKVFLEAGGDEKDLLVNNTVTATGSNVVLKATDDVMVNADVTAFQDAAIWADSNGDTNGMVTQTTGTIEAQNGDLFIAGSEIIQVGPSVFKAVNGTVVMNASNNLNLGSTITGIEAENIVAGAANIFVDTVITGLEAVVLQARDGSIIHTSPGSGQVRGATLGLVASQNIGVSEANPLQVASQFLGTFAEMDEFVVEEDSTSAGLVFNDGFYPDHGPECAEDIPRPFDTEQDILDLLEELIQAEDVLNIVVPGDLIGGILLAGNNATLQVGGTVDLDQIKVGGLLLADIGNNFIVDILMVGSLILDVGGFANVGQFMVDTFANVDVNQSHTGGSMTIGGPLTMNVGGNWVYNSVSLGLPTDNVNVGANVNIGSLDDAGSLNLSVGGNGTVNSFGVGGDLNADFGGSFAGGSLSVSGLTDLDVGTEMDYGSATFGGDADMVVGGNANVGALQANQNLLAMVGGNFAGNSFGVGNEAVLDIGGDWDYETGNVGGLVTAMVDGQTRFGELTAGELELITGSADFGALIVNNNAVIESLGDMNATILDIGGQALFDIGGSFTFDVFDAGNIDVDAGRINMGRVRTSTARFAGSSIVDNGSLVVANSLFLTAGGDIGSEGSPIQLDVAMIDLITGGGNVTIAQNRSGETPIGLIRAGGALNVSVPSGGLVDKNGPELNLASGGDTRLNGLFFGTVSDALEVEVGGNIFMNGAGLDGDTENPGRIFGHFEGIVAGGIPKITYVGDVSIPGLVLLNGQLLLGSQAILIEVARTEAFVVETPEIKSPQGVFGDPYFIHLYMQISEAWNLFLDFILFGEADVTADPEMPEEAKRTIKIGGTEKPYAR